MVIRKSVRNAAKFKINPKGNGLHPSVKIYRNE